MVIEVYTTKIGLGDFSEEKRKLVVVSQRREKKQVGGSVKEGLKCEGRVDHSPAGNQEKAGDESWGVLALLLSCSLLSLCSLFLCAALLSDCHKASARPLSKTNPLTQYPPVSLSGLPGYAGQSVKSVLTSVCSLLQL